MKLNSKKTTPTLTERAISLAVLMGFFCILFHPLTHLSLDLFDAQNDVDQTEHLYIAFNDQSSEQHDDHAECPECILKKHVKIDLCQSVSLQSNDTCRFVTIYQGCLSNQNIHLLFYLRGPPSNVV